MISDKLKEAVKEHLLADLDFHQGPQFGDSLEKTCLRLAEDIFYGLLLDLPNITPDERNERFLRFHRGLTGG